MCTTRAVIRFSPAEARKAHAIKALCLRADGCRMSGGGFAYRA